MKFSVVFFLLVAISFLAQGAEYRDPFSPVIIKETDQGTGETEGSGDEGEEYTVPEAPDVVISGIIWGGDFPQVIIAGEVYREGDTLEDSGAKIIKIEKGLVTFLYRGYVFEKEIQTKGVVK